MELYIRIKNGQPFEHPILGDNFRQAFGCTYEWDGDTVTDVHHVRDMTPAEKTAKQDTAKANWLEHGHASWVFNEDTCSFDSPTPRPTDDKLYGWDEETLAWVEVTEVAPNE